MDAPSYTPKYAAELLGITPKQLGQARKQDAYSPEELWDLRTQLGRFPAKVGPRRQLFLNFKGGTGKTSLSTSYAWRLAELGYSVLLIDLDSQGHATKCLGYEGADFEKTLLDVLVRRVPLAQVIQKSTLPNLDFVPSNLSMATVDLSLMPLAGREFKLRNAVKEVEALYDFVVYDAPPSFGLLNLNALAAANDLFVPVLADFLSYHGVKLLFDTLEDLQQDIGLALDNVCIVVNGFNATFKLGKEALEALQRNHPDYVLDSVVRQCTKFALASSEGRPVFVADPSSKGAQDIDALLQEVLPRFTAAAGRAAKPPAAGT